jgi:hypothetical protein
MIGLGLFLKKLEARKNSWYRLSKFEVTTMEKQNRRILSKIKPRFVSSFAREIFDALPGFGRPVTKEREFSGEPRLVKSVRNPDPKTAR